MSDRAAGNLATLEACFALMADAEVEALIGHYTEDYVLELPYASTGDVFSIGPRSAVEGYLEKAFGVLRFEITIDRVHPSADPDLLILEYHSEGRAVKSGNPYRNRYVGFWWFRDGRVCRTREFTNPNALGKAGIDTRELR